MFAFKCSLYRYSECRTVLVRWKEVWPCTS
jgi:hypothetical protein